jgi:hypothetical protein
MVAGQLATQIAVYGCIQIRFRSKAPQIDFGVKGAIGGGLRVDTNMVSEHPKIVSEAQYAWIVLEKLASLPIPCVYA